jgi:hypothetical protein
MRTFGIAVCWISLSTAVLAEDPPVAPTSGSLYQIPMIEDKFTAEVTAAEARVAKAVADLEKTKQNAGVVRLKSYKSKLSELTKSGNPEQAAAVKARVEWLEEWPEVPTIPPLDQLPPGAAVYQYFPEEERPYLIKDYLLHLTHEPRTLDSLNKKLASAKNAAAEAEIQKDIDEVKERYEKMRSTNEPPSVTADLNNWGQKKRTPGFEFNNREVEWKVGSVGLARNTNIRTLQILGNKQAVMSRKCGTTTQIFVVHGVDTSKLQLGQQNSLGEFGQALWISGMTSYRAANGKDVDVPLIEAFDWGRYKAERGEEMKQ